MRAAAIRRHRWRRLLAGLPSALSGHSVLRAAAADAQHRRHCARVDVPHQPQLVVDGGSAGARTTSSTCLNNRLAACPSRLQNRRDPALLADALPLRRRRTLLTAKFPYCVRRHRDDIRRPGPSPRPRNNDRGDSSSAVVVGSVSGGDARHRRVRLAGRRSSRRSPLTYAADEEPHPRCPQEASATVPRRRTPLATAPSVRSLAKAHETSLARATAIRRAAAACARWRANRGSARSAASAKT